MGNHGEADGPCKFLIVQGIGRYLPQRPRSAGELVAPVLPGLKFVEGTGFEGRGDGDQKDRQDTRQWGDIHQVYWDCHADSLPKHQQRAWASLESTPENRSAANVPTTMFMVLLSISEMTCGERCPVSSFIWLGCDD